MEVPGLNIAKACCALFALISSSVPLLVVATISKYVNSSTSSISVPLILIFSICLGLILSFGLLWIDDESYSPCCGLQVVGLLLVVLETVGQHAGIVCKIEIFKAGIKSPLYSLWGSYMLFY